MDDYIRYLDEQWPGVRDKILKQMQEKGTVTDMVTIPPQVYERVYLEAKNNYAVENYAQAEEMFLGLVLFKGDDVRGWLGYGGACEAQKKWVEGSMAYAMAMALIPGDPVPAYRAGVCLMNQDKVDQAIEVFTLAAGTLKDVKNDPKRLPYAQRAQSMVEMIENKAGA